MKKIYLVVAFLFATFTQAQVGIGTTNPDASSALDIESTTAGLLTPRMTQAQRDAIASPATGLLIYQTNNTPGFYYYDGMTWTPFGGVDNDWTISGNDMYNANTGNIGVGNTAPTAKFHITGTSSGGSGGTSSIYNQDFSSMTIGDVTSTSSTNEYQIIAGAGNDVWEVVSPSESYASVLCTGCTGQWINIRFDCTSQDETFVTGQFSPSATATSLDITFDYRYRYEDGTDEAFNVTLYNETDNTVASSLIALTTTSANTSYSGTFNFSGGNTATDTYSLRFQYVGNCDWGASVDNISVIENASASPTSSVFRLEDGTQQAGYVLTSDANGNATWQAASGGGSAQTLSISGNDLTISGGNTVTLPSGGGGSATADNGLSISGGDVVLGGTLINGTTIDLDDNDLTFSSSTTSAFPGEIIMEGTDRRMMQTNFDQEYVAFGTSSFLSTTVDGQTFTDSGGDSYTIDVALGVYVGTTGGSGFKMGSIEYLTDGLGELFVTHDFSPLDDNSNSSGTANHRWDRVFATNGTIQTSDLNLKKNIQPLSYGLDEILKLETISYNWKENKKGNTRIPENLQERKIGFSAQQLLEVLPETVNTHSWVAADEEGNYKRIKNKNLGVYYSDIIPVTVKAIQEQQAQIEELRAMILELKKENEKLKNNK